MPSPSDLVRLPHGPKAPPPGAKLLGDVDPNEMVHLTVRVRPHTPLRQLQQVIHKLAGQPAHARHHLSRQAFAQQHGASEIDLDKVEEFGRGHGLTVLGSDSTLRSVFLEGSAKDMSRAFGVGLKQYERAGQRFRVRTDYVHVPHEMAQIIEAVVGFDTRPHARPHFRLAEKPAGKGQPRAAGQSFSPLDLAQIYNFPDGDGSGQVIGVIELMLPDGSGFRIQELQQYFSSLGVATPSITTVPVDGGQNVPGNNPGDPKCGDGEVMLDLEVAGTIAPGAKIVVYFAPNTGRGFLDVINRAVHDSVNNPTVISLSWGSAEDPNDPTTDQIDQILQAAAALGVTFCVASGDSGSRDNPADPNHAYVDFPASDPYALGCGGTRLTTSGTTITGEVVWHGKDGGASGGGISRHFPVPSYQQGLPIPPAKNPAGPVGRGVPDVAGDADPATGYTVLVDGQQLVFGGTSAVAPLWAGLVARINQRLGHPVGLLNPVLYQNPTVCRDIVQGDNIDYEAGPGWDPCTGLGSPNGMKLLNALEVGASVNAEP